MGRNLIQLSMRLALFWKRDSNVEEFLYSCSMILKYTFLDFIIGELR